MSKSPHFEMLMFFNANINLWFYKKMIQLFKNLEIQFMNGIFTILYFCLTYCITHELD